MDEIRLRCSECGQRYRLGNDAIVVTLFSKLNKFSLPVTEQSFERFASNRSHPDNVALLGRAWDSLDSSTALDQSEQVFLILDCLRCEPRSRWWQCHLCHKKQPYRLICELEYSGKTIEEATRAARDAWPAERIVSLTVKTDVHPESRATGGGSAAVAERSILLAVPPNAFCVGTPAITREPWHGTCDLLATSKWRARRQWRAQAGAGAQLDGITCIQRAYGGFLGLGRTPGYWRVTFTAPYSARITFSLPAVVAVEIEE